MVKTSEKVTSNNSDQKQDSLDFSTPIKSDESRELSSNIPGILQHSHSATNLHKERVVPTIANIFKADKNMK
jgi:hypothetical protein